MSKPAARLGDTTQHGSPLLGAACTTVLVGGKPAWRIGDQHTCPIPNAPPPACSGTPHGPGATTPVPDGADGICQIGGKPAARVGDIVNEPGALVPLPPPNPIVMGCPTVLIGMMGSTGADDPFLCQTEGHPVDVVSGRVIQSATDIERLSPVPFVFRRFYSSAMQVSGDLGQGWRHNLELSLTQSGDGLRLTDEYGGTLALPRPRVGETLRQGPSRVEALAEDEYVIWRGPDDGLHFRASRGRFLLAGIHDGPDLYREILYDGAQRISAIRDRCGRLFELEFLGGRLVKVVERSCQDRAVSRVCAEYAYDGNGLLASAKDASGAAISYRYDHGLLVQETDRGGFSFFFQYDSARRCVATWGDGGLLYRRLDYDGRNDVTRVTDSRGATRFYYHSGGLVHRLAHGDGAGKTFAYDGQGTLTGEFDETDVGTVRQLDACGREVKSVTPAGGSTEYVYDGAGRVVEAKSSDGRVKRWQYDAAGRPLRYVENDEVRCEWAYNSEGDLARCRGPLDYAAEYDYDAFHRVTSIRDSEGGMVYLSYDDYCNIREVREGGELLVACAYDDCNRLAERVGPDGRRLRYAWNPDGSLAAIRKPDGSESRFEYRWRARTAIHHLSGTAASSTVYEYDNEENLLAIRLSDGTAYRFDWDLRNRLIARHEPGGRTVAFLHDAAGRVVEERCGPHRVSFEYDPAGNLAAVVGPEGEAVRYEYDGFGSVVRGESGAHESVLTYDGCGRLVGEAADGESLAYRYDRGGRRVAIEPSRGVGVGFTYSPSGTLRAVSADGRQLVQYRRDSRGRIVDSCFANGLTEHRGWDASDRVRSLAVWRDRQPLRERFFDYDALSRLAVVRDAGRGEDRFHYAPLGSVDAQSLAGSDGVEVFRLDARENYLDLPGGRRASYGPGDELLADGRWAYEYDALGRTSARVNGRGERTRYHYDFRGLLTRIEHPDGRATGYEYDAFGRRVLKTDAGRSTCYLWDGNQLFASWAAPGEVRQFVMDPFRRLPVAQLEVRGAAGAPDVEARFCHTDHFGAVTEMTSRDGDVVWSVRYDCLGNALQLSGSPDATPLRRPGQYYDEETGYYYNRYRYYDPSAARFTTPDPLHVRGGLNLYRYPGSATTTLDLLGLGPSLLVDNNFLVSLFESDRLGFQTPADMQLANSGQSLGVNKTAYDEFTNAPGFSEAEKARRRKLLKKYKIDPVKLCGGKAKAAYQEAYNRYRTQGLSETDADIAATAKANGMSLISSDRDFVANAAFANNSTQSITALGADSRNAILNQIVLR